MASESAYIERSRTAASIAMTIMLVSFSMLFATLFLGYVVFRVQSEFWPPMGMQRVPLFFPLLSTFFIAVSSFTYWRFEKAFFQRLDKRVMKGWLFATIALALGFFYSQWMLWNAMWELDLYVAAGVFPSLLHAFTWIHLAHMGLGLILLFILSYKIPRTDYAIADENKVVNFGKYWHFVDIVWLLIFVVLFIF